VVGVRVGEQQVELVGAQLLGDLCELLRDLPLQVGVVLRQLVELDQVTPAPLEAVPRGDQLAVLRGLAGRLAGSAWVVPRARPGELGV
jgi:hypothetical protein